MRYRFIALAAVSLAFAACSSRAGVEVRGPQVAVGGGDGNGGGDRAWVCHRGRWQEVGAPAAEGHSRHGDRVSYRARTARASC